MVDEQLATWLRISLEAALTRLVCRCVTEDGLDEEVRRALEEQGVLKDFRTALAAQQPAPDYLHAALLALVRADDVCTAMALINSGTFSQADAPAFVVGLGQEEKTAIVEAQDRLNATHALAGLLDLKRLLLQRVMAEAGRG